MDGGAHFDLFVTIAPAREVAVGESKSWKAVSAVGFAGFDLSLEDCRRILSQLRTAGGNGLIVESRYRTPLVSPEAAKKIAKRELASIRQTTTDQYGPLEGPTDQGAWWIFGTANLTQQEKGMIPGARTIWIDKVDGHVLTRDERREALRPSII